MQSALRLKPTFTDAYNNMASALVQKGLVPAALQCYQTALAVNPNLVHDPALMSCCISFGLVQLMHCYQIVIYAGTCVHCKEIPLGRREREDNICAG